MSLSSRWAAFWAAMAVSLAVWAAPVSQQQALQRADAFLSARGRTVAAQGLVQGHAAPCHNGVPAFYVFNAEEGGFVVLSGDDRTAPVLGFAERGVFSEESAPEGLQWLLQMYGEQIDGLRISENAPVAAGGRPACQAAPVRRNIEPLMASLWNQGEPYNLLCPRYFNQDGSEGDRCATGCVATAVAQVMAFYRYPQATVRTIPGYVASFATDQGEKKVQLRNIPSGSVLDWDNMLPVYHGGESEEQLMAVAQLMYWAGMASKMAYGLSSATYMSDALNGLVRYFGYDDGSHIEQRGSHTIASWHNLLYSEILAGHPVAFAGVNSGGAHAFVIDGYDVEGLFHLNWGWGGLDNGFFRLDVLDPDDSSGIGASPEPGGYNMGQEAVILRLPDEVAAEPVAPRLSVNDWEIRGGDSFFANYVNWSGQSADWNVGIAQVGADGSLSLVGSYNTVHLDANYYSGQTFPVRGLAQGAYRIVPVSKRTADRVWQCDVNPDIRYVLAEVDAQGAVTLSIHPVEEVEVTGIEFPGNHKRGDRQMVRASFRNLGEEYFHEVHLFASLNGQKGESLCRTAVAIEEGAEAVVSLHFTPQQRGSWTVWLAADDRGQNILGSATVEITDEGVATEENLRCMSVAVSNRSGGAVYGDCMQGRVSVYNKGEVTYAGTLRLWLFKKADNGYYYGDASVYVPAVVQPGATVQLPFFFDRLQLNADYAMSVIYEQGGDIENGGLRQMGRTQKGVVCWTSDSTLTGLAPAAIVNTPANALALDMRTLGSSVVTVHPNANPNTLYLLAEGVSIPQGLDDSNVVVGAKAAFVRLSNEWGFCAPLAFTADEAEMVFSALPGWQTVALPFEPSELPQGIRLSQLAELGDDGMPLFTDVAAMDRNIPYLMWVEGDASLRFGGANARFSASRGMPAVVGNDAVRFCASTVGGEHTGVWVLNEARDAFVWGQVAAVAPFSAWLTGSTLPTSIPLPEGGLNAIEVVEAGSVPAAFFNLQGQRVLPQGKGVYITNHKKIMLW